MKKCPKCKKTYDDSWGVCYEDNVMLVSPVEADTLIYIEPAPKEKPRTKICSKCKRLYDESFGICFMDDTILDRLSKEDLERLAADSGVLAVINSDLGVGNTPNNISKSSEELSRIDQWKALLGGIAITITLSWLAFHDGRFEFTSIIFGLIALGFGVITILNALIMFRWVRIVTFTGLAIWGVMAIAQGLAALGTTNLLLLLILWQLSIRGSGQRE